MKREVSRNAKLQREEGGGGKARSPLRCQTTGVG